MSLNQLTANYTDSEKEDNDSGDEKDGTTGISSDDELILENKESAKGTPIIFEEFRGSAGNTPKRKIGRLVSYGPNEDEDEDMFKDDEFDDTINSELINTGTEVVESLPAERNLGIKLPSAPPGKCSAQLQEKVTHMVERVKQGNMDWNRRIQNNKDFRNPSIYEKLIDHLGLDEMGSNYPLEMFDPHCWGKESFCDELAKVQKEEMEKREKEKKEKTKVDILSGTKKPLEEEAKKRKSRFDQAVPGNTAGVLKNSVPPPTLTTVPSGNKPTINAFGSLKKPK